jgi:hypothetical protein
MLAEMFDAIVSWPTFLIALVVFGFAPGAVLRLIVLAFPSDDPRRRELLAELHAVPRLERPFWVVEQLELALFEGLWGRAVWAATGRIVNRWYLESGVELNRAYPESFWIPDEADKQAIAPGATVRLFFSVRDGWSERMWVRVVAVNGKNIIGTLGNQPVGIPRLDYGKKIKFRREHIIDIWDVDDVDDVDEPVPVDAELPPVDPEPPSPSAIGQR